MAGNVDMMIIQPNSPAQVRSGQVRALAVSSKETKRGLSRAADNRGGWLAGIPVGGLVRTIGPKNMPADVLKKNQRRGDARGPDRRGQGCDRYPKRCRGRRTPEAFAEFIQAERRRYETIVRESGMTVE